MTIYAIVNNLISPDSREFQTGPIWTLISQSGILQGGNPYFVPDFASRFEARLALAVKIGRLGKGIAHRFAHRYVEAVAPAVVFVAADLIQNLTRQGLPWTQALSYDKCLAMGKFIQLPFGEVSGCRCALTLDVAGEEAMEASWDNDMLIPGIEDTIAALSRDNTLKTGDIILFGLAGQGPAVQPESRARLYLNGTESLGFNIR